jgi:hypothetical protein
MVDVLKCMLQAQRPPSLGASASRLQLCAQFIKEPGSCRGSDEEVSSTLWKMGIETTNVDHKIRAEQGRGMFDTSGRVDPFDEDGPLKKSSITQFPKNFFLVLRVVQLFRGLISHMDIQFSTAKQWLPYAKDALKHERNAGGGSRMGKFYGL